MKDSRIWISGQEAEIVYGMPEDDLLSRLEEGRDWVQMRKHKMVRVAALCRMYGVSKWRRWCAGD